MDQEEQKQNLVQEIAQVIETQTGVQLSPDFIEELLGDIQREQLKALVYQAFLAIQKSRATPSLADVTPTSEIG